MVESPERCLGGEKRGAWAQLAGVARGRRVFLRLAERYNRVAAARLRFLAHPLGGIQGGQAGPVRGFVIPTLKAIGLFSDRIAGHYREMFAANLGEERARAMDFRLDLPEDLEAWALAET